MRPRTPALDGIRGFAILLVLACHHLSGPLGASENAGLRAIGRLSLQAWSGVDLFFVLSGYLIGGILIDSRGERGYFADFYRRRALRILPAYVLAVGVAPALLLAFGQPISLAPWWTYATFTQNHWQAFREWNVWLAPTWSLAVEEQFYLTLPALVALVRPRQLWRVLLGVALACAAFRCAMYLLHYPDWRNPAYALLPCRADALLAGVLAACAVRDTRCLAWLRAHTSTLRAVAVVAALPMVACTVAGWGVGSTAISTIGYSSNAVLYSAVLLLAITDPATARVLSVRWLRWLGSIAYGLYLVHGPLLQEAFERLGAGRAAINGWGDLALTLGALVVSLVVAHVSWIGFERPIIEWGRRRFARTSTVEWVAAPDNDQEQRAAAAE